MCYRPVSCMEMAFRLPQAEAQWRTWQRHQRRVLPVDDVRSKSSVMSRSAASKSFCPLYLYSVAKYVKMDTSDHSYTDVNRPTPLGCEGRG